ncbi:MULTISPECIES: bestrophin-like domain [Nitrosomonas]|uniref:DUF4239 domain-containing protein n=1 Tax=Nitrosomonas communis TaxID=44574 RepID=A0A0F7KGM5_9PROT|nr:MULTISPECIES: hypothetical protein [Nitrosomonas]AKH37987.1 hypothetical protein AAW31_09450 [Nitrosomonas communis]TYP91593.1 hypothetical protein BCL69_100821 [Nitrosomonas communis]UVS59870.1 hypothetical protein NX761_09930 [Nitrosomonas sp. PLL12]
MNFVHFATDIAHVSGFSALGLFIGLLLVFGIGRYIGVRWLLATESEHTSAGLLDGAIFGLLGLLIAFTFSGAISRFDDRKEMVITEANAIGTAYLRLDLLAVETQPALRALFRQYLDARLEIYQKLPDLKATEVALVRANALQGEIWSAAVKACEVTGSVPTTNLLLTALNEMFDIATQRTVVALEMHPPTIIYVMLFSLALISAGLAGYTTAGIAKHSLTHMVVFAAIIAITVYVILDIEYPRLGLIRVNSVDRVLVELRKSME